MKKIFTTVSFIILALWLSADPVSKELAKKVAINFMIAKKGVAIDVASVKNVYTQTYKSADAFYVYAFPKGGFVIVSANDEANPIIGYSFTSPVAEKVDNPVILKRFEWYAKQIDHATTLKSNKSNVKKEWTTLIEGKDSKNYEAVGPLLQTTWNQSPYYNQLCPAETPTGCVATAMSQIMRYYNWPTSGNGSHKYTISLYGEQFADFASTAYDWVNMPLELTSSSTNTEVTAIATLCYHAGVSVDMEYAMDGSGAHSVDVLYALTSYFKYDNTDINIYYFDANQQTEWINKIKSEIDEGRPIFYSGNSDADGGHAWVCDGYDNSDNLHINWGWGGSYNGYFSAIAMNPGTYNFSESNSMICGIKPATSSQTGLWVKQASAFATKSRGIRHISAVSNDIAWAVAYDGSGNDTATVRDFTKTIDGGLIWTSGTVNAANTKGLESAMITAISEATAWIALYDGTNGGGKIVKTADGGSTWTSQSTAEFSAPNGFPNVIHFWDENNGFCMGDPNGGYFEIYTTTNGGDTWTRVSSENIPANLTGEYGTVGFYCVYGDIVWFATNKGRLFKSTDKGYTWTVSQTPLTESFEISFKDANVGIIQSRGNNSVTRSYRTTDGAQTWTQIIPSGNFYESSFTYIPNTNILIATGSDYSTPFEGVSYSLDDGNTFNDYADFYKNYQFLALGASPDGTVWAGDFNSSAYVDGMWCLKSGAVFSKFSVDKAEVAKGSPAVFTDQSYGTPDSWEWNFGTDATPQTHTGQGPVNVTFSEYGYKNVTLTISKGSEQYVYIKKNALFVTWAESAGTQTDNSKLLPYPNPSSQNIYVKLKGFTKGSINVYSITGALVWSSGGMTENNQINISNLSSGVYLIKVEEPNKNIITRKLTITR